MNKLIVYILGDSKKIVFHGFSIIDKRKKGVKSLPGFVITEEGYTLRKSFNKEKDKELYPDFFIDGIFTGKDIIKEFNSYLQDRYKDYEISIKNVKDLNDLFLISLLEDYLTVNEDDMLVESDSVGYWGDEKEIDDIIDDNRKVFIFKELTDKLVLLNYKEDLDISKKNSKGQVKHHYNEIGKAEDGKRFTIYKYVEKPKLIEDLYEYFKQYMDDIIYPVVIDLNVLFNRNNYRLYRIFGNKIFTFNKFRESKQVLINNTPLIYEPKPVVGTKILLDYVYNIEKSMKNSTVLDITNILYEETTKGYKLRKEIKGLVRVPVKFMYRGKPKEGIFMLNLGGDTLSYQILARVAPDIERVEILYHNRDKGLYTEYVVKYYFKDSSYALTGALFNNKVFISALR